MNILQIIDLAYEAGGAEKSVKLISSEMKKRGHKVTVLATDAGLKGKKSYADIILPALDDRGARKLYVHLWSFKRSSQIRKIIKDVQPDIIHLHTIGGFSPSVLSATKHIPTVMTVHGPEGYTLKMLRWQLFATDFRDSSYQWRDIRLSGIVRFSYYRFLVRPAFLLVRNNLKALIAPSKFMAETVKSDAGKVPIIHLYNGIELPKPAPIKNSQSLLFVGRIEAVKGVSDLIKAFDMVAKKLPSANLTIVGDGKETENLKKFINNLACANRIIFTGWIKPENINNLYAQASLMVIPSIWPENLPTVAIEALAIGLPIVGTDVGGIPELVSPGKNGWIVPAGNPEKLSKAMLRILESADEKFNDFHNYSILQSQTFNIESFINSLEKIYIDAAK